jgi:plasmid replication initiation protein
MEKIIVTDKTALIPIHKDIIVRKSNEYVHITNNMTLIQRRMVNALLHNAYDDILTKETHCISVSQLMQLISPGEKVTTKNIGHIKEAFRTLMNVKFEWDILDTNEDDWTVVTAVSEVRIKGGICYYSYAPTMREKLSNPKFFAQINLELSNSFSSTYAGALYELILSFRVNEQSVWNTGYLPLEPLKRILGCHQHASYSEFKILNRNVIKPAINEIHSQTNFTVTASPMRENRKVASVNFFIEQKKSSDEADGNSDEVDITVINNANPDTVMKMRSFGLNQKQIVKFLTEIHPKELIEIIQYIVNTAQSGKVDNLTAFSYTAFKNRYKPGKSAATFVAKQVAAPESKVVAEAKKALEQKEALRAEYALWRQELVAKRFEILSDVEKNNHLSAFLENADATIVELYRKSGSNSAIVKKSFKFYLINKLLSGDEGDFEAWLANKK